MIKKLLAFTCLTMSLGANAAVVEILFEGSITSVSGDVPLSIGTNFSATLVYDTDYATGTDYGVQQYYDFSASPVAYTLDVELGSYGGGGSDGSVSIINDWGGNGDWFQTSSSSGFSGDSIGGYAWESTRITLKDTDGLVFGDTSLQTALPNLSEFEASFATMFFDGASADATITAMNVSAVPLPAAVWLFGSALLGLGAMKRKKA
jgi:hypothetical protein